MSVPADGSDVPRGTSGGAVAGPPPAAGVVFGDRLPLAERYAAWLAGEGIVRGLMGPRETSRLWERHLLNGAALAEVVPPAARVADLGSGAGLPGLALAIRRPQQHVTLVEPQLRRTTFLEEVVADLGLTHVEIVRARAEELHGRRTFDVVTARALAPLPRLLRWALPLTEPGGVVVALKGSSAAAEVASVRELLGTLGATPAEVLEVGEESWCTTVVRVRREPAAPVASSGRRGRRRPRP